MLLAWACSVLLLGCVVGSPLYHSDTKNSTSDNGAPPLPVNSEANSSNTTVNATLSSSGKRMFLLLPPPVIFRMSGTRKAGCILPTCAVHHLSEKLQAGDESAGDTHDPYGVGKR
ncbi:uncharacterized protein zgc:193726 isoform X4 [Colossoma macropomum]|uniref:uncharacterized protein zgc:193726 isoform X4 n=1 Tax=Colossoma macropomum TaxID=42526 RepID=UPI0018649B5A|nr:uncharacterized protein zgc:193726 isoform X4 [Colossoma macropomum]